MPKYKGCPLLVQSDTCPSMMITGESHTRTYMLECIAGKCAAFRADSEFCDKFMAYVRLPQSAQQGEEKQ